MSHVNVVFVSFQGYADKIESSLFKRIKILILDPHRRLSAIISPYKFMQRHFSEGCLFLSEKNLWDSVLETNKKKVLPKSYSLKTRTDSVNQTLKNKEKFT